ncbi:MAG: CsgG/HfaB family protein [Planctomycetes bacterium]|nr:CsgG/HfaB family protein [Planctomycetota bacterium]MBU1517501.1 CsgG/HfaB family protein [Planctomycetota bacterium]MBU2457013.1 CsgG/HfaB family protein [Planctomycetota bacterium]
MRNYVLITILMAGYTFVEGCAAGKSTARTDYDFSKVSKIAVVDVLGPLGNEGAKNQVADMLTMELLQKGYAPIERAQVQNILNEQKFQHDPNMTSEQDVVEMGNILNVPTIMIINVSQFSEDISMTIKMLDAKDGSVLWVGSGQGSTEKILSTILGAAAGAGAGVAASGEDSKDKVVGGVIGGVIGGAAGNLLAPQKAEATQKVISKICKDMPARIPAAKKKGLFH